MAGHTHAQYINVKGAYQCMLYVCRFIKYIGENAKKQVKMASSTEDARDQG